TPAVLVNASSRGPGRGQQCGEGAVRPAAHDRGPAAFFRVVLLPPGRVADDGRVPDPGPAASDLCGRTGRRPVAERNLCQWWVSCGGHGFRRLGNNVAAWRRRFVLGLRWVLQCT